MADVFYEQASTDLRNFLESHRKESLDDEWDLERALRTALFNRYRARNIPDEMAESVANDDATLIVNNLETLHPILAHYWRYS